MTDTPTADPLGNFQRAVAKLCLAIIDAIMGRNEPEPAPPQEEIILRGPIEDLRDQPQEPDQPGPPPAVRDEPRLSEHFTVAEFTASDKARALGIDNTPTVEALHNMRRTAHLLERIRAHLSALAGRDIPILLSSGYRCPALNNAVGSAPGSAHVQGLAADFTAPAFGDPLAVAKAIEASDIMGDVDQLINEFGRWVHVSADPRKRNQALTIYSAGGRAKTIQGLHAVK